MLTPAQQKVKQELEELKANASYREHPMSENPIPAKTNSHKNWIFAAFGIILLIFSSMLTINLAGPKNENVVTYLKKEQRYQRESSTLLEDCLENRAPNLQWAKVKQNELITMLKNLPVPSGFREYNQELLSVFEQRLFIITYLAETKTIDPFLLQKSLIELDVKQELAKDNLLKAFDSQKIIYRVQENREIEYWVSGKSYLYEE
ncbi:hypothetical protein [Neobacillus rhizophilus]|uniref:Uncharacterized protein n=1 Tax=Neobacillus rhizophilus TaxID=2833579 RepID=A0A942U620_9BACI|nr:hypothetical protein [Neobacillus rhizophilus]MBS4213107.1 hypothetical protein [Neobacillus rhizophilus]